MRWWKKSLAIQLTASMLLALIISQAIALAFSWWTYLGVIQTSARNELNSRASAVARMIELVPDDFRADLARVSSTEYTRFWVSEDQDDDLDAWATEAFHSFQLSLRDYLRPAGQGHETHRPATAPPVSKDAVPELFTSHVKWTSAVSEIGDNPVEAKYIGYAGTQGAGIVVPLGDGLALNGAYYKHTPPSVWATQLPLNIAVTALLVSLAGFVTARRLVRPLVHLTRAAEKLGRGEPVTPLSETGPEDIQRTAIAFNQMQERLHRFVQDKTRMLGAIGHDMRTPLTILRLRAELVSDRELQFKMLKTIDEMEAMTEACLALAKQETSLEVTRTIDLAALVESICEDLSEMGSGVTVQPMSRLNYRCRPDALRRTIRNLIENAVRYAGHATVHLHVRGGSIEVAIEDNGPGIPEDQMEDVFAPFYRIEDSRSRETGGTGLGLSIARAIARQHGGDVVLAALGPGLRASIVLPM